MPMTFHLQWLKEKGVVFEDGACDEGYEIALRLAGNDRDIDANELFNTWINSPEVPSKFKRYALYYRSSRDALEGYMYKKFGSLENIVRKNEFKVSKGYVEKTCKTEVTAKKYKEQFIDEVYNTLEEPVTIHLLREDGFLMKISMQIAMAYKPKNAIFVIKSRFGHRREVQKENIKIEYDKVIAMTRNQIETDMIKVKRLITDPDDFFAVWVDHTV